MYWRDSVELIGPFILYTQLSEPKPSAKLIAKYRHAFQWIRTKIASTT